MEKLFHELKIKFHEFFSRPILMSKRLLSRKRAPSVLRHARVIARILI
jgi:hypothetical protein